MSIDFLQTAGIASQASDQFDTERQARRVMSQREQLNQDVIDENKLYREIVKLAYAHEYGKEQEVAAAAALAKQSKGKLGAIAAPVAPGFSELKHGGAVKLPGYKAGGSVQPPKKRFSGVYDDTQSGDRMPTIFSEWFEDQKAPGRRFGDRLESTINELVGHVQSFAEGGVVSEQGPFTGSSAPLPGESEEAWRARTQQSTGVSPVQGPFNSPVEETEEQKRRRLLDEQLATGATGLTEDPNSAIPGIKVRANPTAFAGRLLNTLSGTVPELITPSGTPASTASGAAVGPDEAARLMDLNSPGGPDPGQTSVDDGGTGTGINPNAAQVAEGIVSTIGGLVVGQVPGIVGNLGSLAVQAGKALADNPPVPVVESQVTSTNEADAQAAVASQAVAADNAAIAASNVAAEASNAVSADSGAAAAAAAAATAADAGAGAEGGPGDSGGAAASGDGGASGAGDGGGAAWAEGGKVSLWKFVKSRMTPKTQKRAAVNLKQVKKAKKLKGGGRVRGPGTATSDSVNASIDGRQPARLSNREYVLPVDTVIALGNGNYQAGVAKLDALRAQTHKNVRR